MARQSTAGVHVNVVVSGAGPPSVSIAIEPTI